MKAPEICRQTGFSNANTADAQKDLAIQGAAAEAAAIVLLVTACLGVLQTLNYHWHCLTTPCCSNCSNICETFGKPCGLDIGSVLCGCPIDCCRDGVCMGCCAKENIVDVKNGGDGFKVPHEAATIFLSFFVHNVLITVFGVYGSVARDQVEDKCFSVHDVGKLSDDGTAWTGCVTTAADLSNGVYKCVYGTSGTPLKANTAKDFLAGLTGTGNIKDAKTHMEQRGNVYDVALVFWWINTICFFFQLLSYLLSHERSVDMDMVAIRTRDDLCCGDISTDEKNNISVGEGYAPVSQSSSMKVAGQPYRVQLRGNF